MFGSDEAHADRPRGFGWGACVARSAVAVLSLQCLVMEFWGEDYGISRV